MDSRYNLEMSINLDNLTHNVESLINNYKGYKYYFGNLNANSYGHGYGVVKTLIKSGINYLIVPTFIDAVEVRKRAKNIPILCLEKISNDNLLVAYKNDITITIYNYTEATKVSTIKRNINCHLKLDIGPNQIGIDTKEELERIFKILEPSKVKIEGIYANFSEEDDFNAQLERLLDVTSLIDLNSIEIIHMYSSIPLLKYPKLKIANGVRLGIIMYGINPIEQVLPVDLREVLNVYTTISDLKTMDNLDQTKLIKSAIYTGIIPVGYALGLTKNNIGRNVAVNFKRYKILDISMNLSIVEADEDIKVGDKVILFGGLHTLVEASKYLNIPIYELLCFSPSIPRYYYTNNECIEIERR